MRWHFSNSESTLSGYVNDPQLLPGLHGAGVSIPHGHHAATVNRLTSKDDIDVVTGMVRYSGIPVSLHPA